MATTACASFVVAACLRLTTAPTMTAPHLLTHTRNNLARTAQFFCIRILHTTTHQEFKPPPWEEPFAGNSVVAGLKRDHTAAAGPRPRPRPPCLSHLLHRPCSCLYGRHKCIPNISRLATRPLRKSPKQTNTARLDFKKLIPQLRHTANTTHHALTHPCSRRVSCCCTRLKHCCRWWHFPCSVAGRPCCPNHCPQAR